MDLETLDAWYELEKDKLTELYRKKVEKGKNKDKLKKNYISCLNSLHSSYENRCKSSIDRSLSLHQLKYRWKIFRFKHLSFLDAMLEKFQKKE